jgi:hypothetical protein
MEKRFLIKCSCGWKRLSDGTSEDLKDLKDLKEIVNCSTCGKNRQFVCQKCGGKAKQFRIKGNS